MVLEFKTIKQIRTFLPIEEPDEQTSTTPTIIDGVVQSGRRGDLYLYDEDSDEHYEEYDEREDPCNCSDCIGLEDITWFSMLWRQLAGETLNMRYVLCGDYGPTRYTTLPSITLGIGSYIYIYKYENATIYMHYHDSSTYPIGMAIAGEYKIFFAGESEKIREAIENGY